MKFLLLFWSGNTNFQVESNNKITKSFDAKSFLWFFFISVLFSTNFNRKSSNMKKFLEITAVEVLLKMREKYKKSRTWLSREGWMVVGLLLSYFVIPIDWLNFNPWLGWCEKKQRIKALDKINTLTWIDVRFHILYFVVVVIFTTVHTSTDNIGYVSSSRF